MQFRILGPLDVVDKGETLPLGGGRPLALFALLLLHANEVVPSEQLLMDLWGEDSPPGAANSLQAAISRLRRVLPRGRLITEASGYLLRIFPEELDVSQFEQLVSEGREALTAGAAEQAARTLRQALSLWQGPALADFRYEPFAQAEIVRLEELHLTCLEERIEADLALGLASVLVAELRQLVSEHPVRERLRGQLMLALYRDGRQADQDRDEVHGRDVAERGAQAAAGPGHPGDRGDRGAEDRAEQADGAGRGPGDRAADPAAGAPRGGR